METIYEVTQMKGDGEAHPLLSPTDEFADFETWDRSNITAQEPKTWRWPASCGCRWSRSGRTWESAPGVLVLKHFVREDNWFGKMKFYEPHPTRGEHWLNKFDDDKAGYLLPSWR